MIKKIGNTQIQPTHKANCHCGLVQFEINLPDGINGVGRCNCSICRRKGAVVGAVSLDDLKVTQGEEFLTLYQFNSNTAKHYFCSKCGIYTHHQRRSNPQQYSFNIACLESVNPFEIENVPVGDGINHSSDR